MPKRVFVIVSCFYGGIFVKLESIRSTNNKKNNIVHWTEVTFLFVMKVWMLKGSVLSFYCNLADKVDWCMQVSNLISNWCEISEGDWCGLVTKVLAQ